MSIPEFNLKIEKTAVTAAKRKLKAKWIFGETQHPISQHKIMMLAAAFYGGSLHTKVGEPHGYYYLCTVAEGSHGQNGIPCYSLRRYHSVHFDAQDQSIVLPDRMAGEYPTVLTEQEVKETLSELQPEAVRAHEKAVADSAQALAEWIAGQQTLRRQKVTKL